MVEVLVINSPYVYIRTYRSLYVATIRVCMEYDMLL